MNIFKKSKKIYLIMLVVAILIIPVFYVLNKSSYRFRVDQSYAQKVKQDLQLVPGYFSDGILRTTELQDKNSLPVKFDNWFIKLETEPVKRNEGNNVIYYSIDSIKISKDEGKTWDNLFTFNNLGTTMCRVAVVHNGKIDCIVNGLSVGLNLLVIDGKGQFINKALTKSDITGPEVLAAYTKDNNKLILVWRDQRARFPVFDFIDPARGPYLIIAGELNLDTLEFKEHIIGYNISSLKELFGKMILKGLFEDPRADQRIVGRPEPGVTITETESGHRVVNIDTSNTPGESQWSVIERYLKK